MPGPKPGALPAWRRPSYVLPPLDRIQPVQTQGRNYSNRRNASQPDPNGAFAGHCAGRVRGTIRGHASPVPSAIFILTIFCCVNEATAACVIGTSQIKGKGCATCPQRGVTQPFRRLCCAIRQSLRQQFRSRNRRGLFLRVRPPVRRQMFRCRGQHRPPHRHRGARWPRRCRARACSTR